MVHRELAEAQADNVERKYKIQTRFVTVDFASPSSRAEKFAELEQTLSTMDVGVLVNNVGASHEMPVAFEETSAEEMENIIQTVIYPPVHFHYHHTSHAVPHDHEV